MNFAVTVAIDGPSGSGKSSVSKAIARQFGFHYLDTGAMYRAVAWWCIDQGIDLADSERVARACIDLPLDMPLDPDRQRLLVDGRDITSAMRTPAISTVVSKVATNLAVRANMKERQRALIARSRALGSGIVAEGRDVTTVVAPDAEVRVLLSASQEARLHRRSAQLTRADVLQSEDALRDQVLRRDQDDATVSAFFEPAEGVVGIDTSGLTFQQSVAAVAQTVNAQKQNQL